MYGMALAPGEKRTGRDNIPGVSELDEPHAALFAEHMVAALQAKGYSAGPSLNRSVEAMDSMVKELKRIKRTSRKPRAKASGVPAPVPPRKLRREGSRSPAIPDSGKPS